MGMHVCMHTHECHLDETPLALMMGEGACGYPCSGRDVLGKHLCVCMRVCIFVRVRVCREENADAYGQDVYGCGCVRVCV
jgi:hypothetical protein